MELLKNVFYHEITIEVLTTSWVFFFFVIFMGQKLLSTVASQKPAVLQKCLSNHVLQSYNQPKSLFDAVLRGEYYKNYTQASVLSSFII